MTTAEEIEEHRRGTQMIVSGDILQQPSGQLIVQLYCYLRLTAGRQVNKADQGYFSPPGRLVRKHSRTTNSYGNFVNK